MRIIAFFLLRASAVSTTCQIQFKSVALIASPLPIGLHNIHLENIAPPCDRASHPGPVYSSLAPSRHYTGVYSTPPSHYHYIHNRLSSTPNPHMSHSTLSISGLSQGDVARGNYPFGLTRVGTTGCQGSSRCPSLRPRPQGGAQGPSPLWVRRRRRRPWTVDPHPSGTYKRSTQAHESPHTPYSHQSNVLESCLQMTRHRPTGRSIHLGFLKGQHHFCGCLPYLLLLLLFVVARPVLARHAQAATLVGHRHAALETDLVVMAPVTLPPNVKNSV